MENRRIYNEKEDRYEDIYYQTSDIFDQFDYFDCRPNELNDEDTNILEYLKREGF